MLFLFMCLFFACDLLIGLQAYSHTGLLAYFLKELDLCLFFDKLIFYKK